MPILIEYFHTTAAAKQFVFAQNTLRNWFIAMKFVAVRHPVNDYRLFKLKELDALLKQVAVARKKATK
jgi:hypothetical protein